MSPDHKENKTLTRTPTPVLPVKDENILLSPRLQQKYIISITIVTTISKTRVQNTRQEQRHEHGSD